MAYHMDFSAIPLRYLKRRLESFDLIPRSTAVCSGMRETGAPPSRREGCNKLNDSITTPSPGGRSLLICRLLLVPPFAVVYCDSTALVQSISATPWPEPPEEETHDG